MDRRVVRQVFVSFQFRINVEIIMCRTLPGNTDKFYYLQAFRLLIILRMVPPSSINEEKIYCS